MKLKHEGQQYEIRPILPKNKDGSQKKGRYGKKPATEIVHAYSADAAMKLAVVRGIIPANTLMSYYEAIPLRK
jgi:hypothetical protein